MISARQALAPGPGIRGGPPLGAGHFLIRFERFPVFQPSGSAGGHDSRSPFGSPG